MEFRGRGALGYQVPQRSSPASQGFWLYLSQLIILNLTPLMFAREIPMVPIEHKSHPAWRKRVSLFHGEGNGNPLQYSCLENPVDGGAWCATVHGVAKSWTRLSDFTHSLTFPWSKEVSL